MKDSQHSRSVQYDFGKYIKVNNERFSTNTLGIVILNISISR